MRRRSAERSLATAAMLILMLTACERGGSGKAQPVEIQAPPPVDLPELEPVKAAPPPTPARPDVNDTTLLPGDRVGLIVKEMNLEKLQAVYGEKTCRNTSITLEDGTVEAATRLQRGAADSATVVWWDASRASVKEVRDLGKAWRTPEGVGVGSTLEELEAALGPFKLYGFGWDYAGTVSLEGTRYHRYRNRLFIRLAPSKRDPERITRASGDRLYDSSEPEMKAVAPVVAELVISLDTIDGADGY